MRKQYYFRESPQGLLAWDVDHLVELSRSLPRRTVRLSMISESDGAWLHGEDRDAMAEHFRLIEEADLTYPIILAADGAVMDGRHRVAKAKAIGHSDIDAVQFAEDPPPDFIGVGPDELPY